MKPIQGTSFFFIRLINYNKDIESTFQ